LERPDVSVDWLDVTLELMTVGGQLGRTVNTVQLVFTIQQYKKVGSHPKYPHTPCTPFCKPCLAYCQHKCRRGEQEYQEYPGNPQYVHPLQLGLALTSGIHQDWQMEAETPRNGSQRAQAASSYLPPCIYSKSPAKNTVWVGQVQGWLEPVVASCTQCHTSNPAVQ
jgi:hypothetical protein